MLVSVDVQGPGSFQKLDAWNLLGETRCSSPLFFGGEGVKHSLETDAGMGMGGFLHIGRHLWALLLLIPFTNTP